MLAIIAASREEIPFGYYTINYNFSNNFACNNNPNMLNYESNYHASLR
jgi:hypothetical protein